MHLPVIAGLLTNAADYQPVCPRFTAFASKPAPTDMTSVADFMTYAPPCDSRVADKCGGLSACVPLTHCIRQQAGSHGYDVSRRFHDLCMPPVGAGSLANAFCWRAETLPQVLRDA
jgi:hypothetical protein